jgi:hypothetical protein
MSDIPVGETITLEWPENVVMDASSDITALEYRRSFDALEAQLVDWLTKPCVFDRIPLAPMPVRYISRKNGKPALLAAVLDAHIVAEPGKPPPTGILTVHEGRVGGIPLCTD